METGRQVDRVVVVDDHPLIRRGLSDILNREPDFEVCAEASTILEGLAAARETEPSVMTIDLTLRDGSGLELIKEIKAAFPQIRMLVSSMQDESLYAERCQRAGANGYINKEVPPETVIAALRKIVQGEIYLSPEMSRRLLNRMVSGQDSDGSTVAKLTDRELEVFEEIGRGQTTREIAEKLGVSHKTIETHRANIKQKLVVKNATQLVQRAVHWLAQSE